MKSPREATNVFQFEALARDRLSPEVFEFIAGAADDGKTLQENIRAFDDIQIRARRLVDVSAIDTSVEILGSRFDWPVLLAPIGVQGTMYQDGELTTVRGAGAGGHGMIVSTISSTPIGEITAAAKSPVWFQLYPTTNRDDTKKLLVLAEAAGCPVVLLTVDVPVVGNREGQAHFLQRLLEASEIQMGNFPKGKPPEGLGDPSLTWEFVSWLKANTKMKVGLKGIVTKEDAKLCVEHGVDLIVVSNHGGRQEESGLGTIECLPEVIAAVANRLPVLLDGGIRRGTDIFKALALGARAVCVGRPYLWGLASFGQPGVERVLEILGEELVRIMQLAGTPTVAGITRSHIQMRSR